MSKFQSILLYLFLTAILCGTNALGPVADVQGANTSAEAKSSLMVRGEVVMISGDLQVVENALGRKEVTMVVKELFVLPTNVKTAVGVVIDETTQLDNEINIGDKVEAQVSATAHAFAIRKIS